MSGYRTVPHTITVTPEALAAAEADFETAMGYPPAEALDRIHADLARALAADTWRTVPFLAPDLPDHDDQQEGGA